MAEKGKTTTVKKRTVKLFLDWKLWEYDINEKLPMWFLQSKLRSDQLYMPVWLYRNIMRQIGEFWMPKFSEEKFISWNNKSGRPMITYKSVCNVEWKRWKEVTQLEWIWFSSISAWAFLSDAVHWNMHTLYAKALRDALKYTYNIFEFPETDIEDQDTEWKVDDTSKKIDEVVSNIDAKEKEKVVEKDDTEWTMVWDKIKEEYTKLRTWLYDDFKLDWKTVTKKDVLKLATTLKEMFGEENKPYIAKLITPDVNWAA